MTGAFTCSFTVSYVSSGRGEVDLRTRFRSIDKAPDNREACSTFESAAAGMTLAFSASIGSCTINVEGAARMDELRASLERRLFGILSQLGRSVLDAASCSIKVRVIVACLKHMMSCSSVSSRRANSKYVMTRRKLAQELTRSAPPGRTYRSVKRSRSRTRIRCPSAAQSTVRGAGSVLSTRASPSINAGTRVALLPFRVRH